MRNLVKELRRVRVGELQANKKNWRVHTQEQASALRAILTDVGFADALIAYERNDGKLELIDGHLRAAASPDMEVPVLVLDCTRETADKILATLDPLAAMATRDTSRADELAEGMSFDNEHLMGILREISPFAGVDEGGSIETHDMGKRNALKFPDYEIPMTDDEARELRRVYDVYIDEHLTGFGFAGWMVDCVRS